MPNIITLENKNIDSYCSANYKIVMLMVKRVKLSMKSLYLYGIRKLLIVVTHVNDWTPAWHPV